MEWHRHINAELLSLTVAKLNQAGQITKNPKEYARFNPEVDATVDFLCGSLVERTYSQKASFRGSRLLYVAEPPEGMKSQPATEPANDPEGVALEVEIIPDRLAWHPRETVHGKFRLRNIGKRRVSIRPWDCPQPYLLDASGHAPPVTPAKIFICGTPLFSMPPMVIRSGEVRECMFSIETDPLALAGGVNVEPGRYTLNFSDLRDRLNIPTRIQPVPIEFRLRKGVDLGPRIVRFSAGGNRITVLREDGSLSAHEAHTGALLARHHIANYIPRPSYEQHEWFSRDARFVVTTDQPGGLSDRCSRITIHALDVTGTSQPPRTISVMDPSLHGLRPRWMDEHGGTLVLASTEQIVTVEVATGQIVSSTNVGRPCDIAPDGQHAYLWPAGDPWGGTPSWADDPTIPKKECDPPFIARMADLARTVPIETGDPTQIWSWWPGLRALYMAFRGSRPIVRYGFDGKANGTFQTEAKGIVAESADGRFVVFEVIGDVFEPKPNRLELWDADTLTKLWQTDGHKHRTAAFVTDPLRLVCATTVMPPDENGLIEPWYDNTFEIFDVLSGELIEKLRLPPD